MYGRKIAKSQFFSREFFRDLAEEYADIIDATGILPDGLGMADVRDALLGRIDRDGSVDAALVDILDRSIQEHIDAAIADAEIRLQEENEDNPHLQCPVCPGQVVSVESSFTVALRPIYRCAACRREFCFTDVSESFAVEKTAGKAEFHGA